MNFLTRARGGRTGGNAATGATAAATTAIIDIGSNSVRLVVYGAPARLPTVLFNEKVLAGLGRSLSATGTIDAEAMRLAAGALARFASLVRAMEADRVRTVATAAVREASNGEDLLAIAEAEGLVVEVLSGEQEASASGMGVLSAFPNADGIVGDLGGGSLELVRVAEGSVGERVSFPLGVLRLQAIRDGGKHALDRRVASLLRDAGWAGRGTGLPFYLVGGSWRALTQFDMHRSAYPLPIVHGYRMTASRVTELSRIVAGLGKQDLRAVPNLSGGRIPTLADAAALLAAVLRETGCDATVTSAFGLREGLLFDALSPADRLQDPLLAAAREEGRRLCRFVEHGDLLNDWIAPLFADDPPTLARLRHAACLLADVGWHANPEFRAERGLEIALHGHWFAIDAAGRALLAQALYTCLGGGSDSPEPIPGLANPDGIERARQWGLAMRLGQRLSGGVAGPLQRTRMDLDGGVRLLVDPAERALYGEAVEKRHRALANALGLVPLLA